MVASTTAEMKLWEVNKSYIVGQIVTVDATSGVPAAYYYKQYWCAVAHTASAFVGDYGNGKWVVLQTAEVKGDKGDKGDTGDQGVQGDQGVAGSNGAAGADGVFASIASQAEAQAGADNTKGMTPLRVAQAITALLPSHATIVSILASIASHTSSIGDLLSRVNILEGLSPLNLAFGVQRCNNNQLVALDIDASAGEGGSGNAFTLDADGATSAEVLVEIYRKDDAETRFASITLILQYIENVWYIGRRVTTVLIGEMDGVEFGVNQVGNACTVTYTSDNMAGGNYSSASYIKFRIQEISNA